jgi:hypothetical protein
MKAVADEPGYRFEPDDSHRDVRKPASRATARVCSDNEIGARHAVPDDDEIELVESEDGEDEDDFPLIHEDGQQQVGPEEIPPLCPAEKEDQG